MCSSDSGIGAPPLRAIRSEDRSASAKRGVAASARYIEVTPKSRVTRSDSITSTACTGSNLASSSAVPPLSTVGNSTWLSAAVWNSGAVTRATSALVRSTSTIRLCTFHTTLPWVSTTPFGRPVVPEVYCTMKTSSSPTGSSTSEGSAGTSASRSSRPAPAAG